MMFRAKNGTRTRDPNLGKVVLYQLSYFRDCCFRAKNGTRTRDPNLGKVVLYQLSYFRKFAVTGSTNFFNILSKRSSLEVLLFPVCECKDRESF